MPKSPTPMKPGEKVLIAMIAAAVIAFVLFSIGFGVMEHNGTIR